ncbi:hypothetical protein [Pseudomonas sp. LP_7_YM]|uniref:hypothetical protein n=1 Tax=Pseudomonas sp. LP_7_YM TaxID=2485137 RepID=UPI00105C5C20|nr:hypothetical protein [Pseudomonas sp. LP_7_YM]TDV72464.1 hypothetical protein EC915_101610 [Pseudomonas sp. LP_7_YM]
MSQFTGKVVKRNLKQSFGWIKYDPADKDDDDEIYFMWDSRRDGELPDVGASVTFSRERDPEKSDGYIATNVKVKK